MAVHDSLLSRGLASASSSVLFTLFISCLFPGWETRWISLRSKSCLFPDWESKWMSLRRQRDCAKEEKASWLSTWGLSLGGSILKGLKERICLRWFLFVCLFGKASTYFWVRILDLKCRHLEKSWDLTYLLMLQKVRDTLDCLGMAYWALPETEALSSAVLCSPFICAFTHSHKT